MLQGMPAPSNRSPRHVRLDGRSGRKYRRAVETRCQIKEIDTNTESRVKACHFLGTQLLLER